MSEKTNHKCDRSTSPQFDVCYTVIIGFGPICLISSPHHCGVNDACTRFVLFNNMYDIDEFFFFYLFVCGFTEIRIRELASAVDRPLSGTCSFSNSNIRLLSKKNKKKKMIMSNAYDSHSRPRRSF